MIGARRSIINISSTNAVYIVGALSAIFLTPFILHRVGTEQYAIWVVLNSLIAYFGLSRLGFTTKMLRDLSGTTEKDENKVINSVFFSILLIQLLLSPILILSFFWLRIFVRSADGTYFQMAFVSLYVLYGAFIFNIIGGIFSTIFYSRNKHYFVNGVVIGRTLLNLLIVIVAGYVYALNIIVLSLITLGLYIVSTVIFYFGSKKMVSFSLKYTYFDKEYIKRSIMPSIQFFIISIGALIIFQSDSLVISSFLGTAAVTTYALGYKLVEIPRRLIWNIPDVLFPKLSNFYSNRQWNDLMLLIKKIFSIVVPLTIIVAGILYLFGTFILKIWVGKEYVVAKGILNLFIIAFIFQTIEHTYGIVINAIGKQKAISYMVILEAFLNLTISIILVQRIGLIGVAIGTLIAHLLGTGWFAIYYANKNLKELVRNK